MSLKLRKSKTFAKRRQTRQHNHSHKKQRGGFPPLIAALGVASAAAPLAEKYGPSKETTVKAVGGTLAITILGPIVLTCLSACCASFSSSALSILLKIG